MGRGSAEGSGVIQLLGLMFITLMVSALAVDFSYYFAAQNELQTAADSAALAAATDIYRSIETDPSLKLADASKAAQDYVSLNETGMTLSNQDVVFGFVNPATKIYNENAFRTPSPNPNYSTTGGYNSVYVRVQRGGGSSNSPLNTVMASMLGILHMDTEAHSVALVDQTINGITDGGVRPIYVCQAQFDRAMQDGIPDNDVVRIYGDHVEVNGVQNQVGCPALGSGNWGFADLRNCSPDAVGTSTIKDWFVSGFPGSVYVGSCYSSDPGNFIPSIQNQLDTLIANQTIFPLPLYNSWSGGGSNSMVNVSGFVGFKMTGYKSNGSASSRYIEGRFERFSCKDGCTSGTTGTTVPGGAIVKIRLASQS